MYANYQPTVGYASPLIYQLFPAVGGTAEPILILLRGVLRFGYDSPPRSFLAGDTVGQHGFGEEERCRWVSLRYTKDGVALSSLTALRAQAIGRSALVPCTVGKPCSASDSLGMRRDFWISEQWEERHHDVHVLRRGNLIQKM